MTALPVHQPNAYLLFRVAMKARLMLRSMGKEVRAIKHTGAHDRHQFATAVALGPGLLHGGPLGLCAEANALFSEQRQQAVRCGVLLRDQSARVPAAAAICLSDSVSRIASRSVGTALQSC